MSEKAFKPYCFIIMPFGIKKDAHGRSIYFDEIYNQLYRPAIEEAGWNPIRADEEFVGGVIHKPMYERLMLCDYAIADLTTANANVFYEVGIRHGIRPSTTVLTFSATDRLPFDVAPLRGLPYSLDKNGKPNNVKKDVAMLVKRFKEVEKPVDDSPLFQLIENMPRTDISRLKTDTFRDQIEYSKKYKSKLAEARQKDSVAVNSIEQTLGKLSIADPAIIIDLYLSYRAVKDWKAMVRLVDEMPPMLQPTILVQEQLGFALNRLGESKKAEAVLKQVISEHGPSSETNGILGRVYKDLWSEAVDSGDRIEARGHLKKAINCYLEGFEADWRDAYPGVNAVTLMEMTNPVDPRQQKLIPVVRYAVEHRIHSATPDYWDYATLMELNILGNDEEGSLDALADALANVREKWEPETTANNIQMIIDVRKKRKEDVEWIEDIHTSLAKSAT